MIIIIIIIIGLKMTCVSKVRKTYINCRGPTFSLATKIGRCQWVTLSLSTYNYMNGYLLRWVPLIVSIVQSFSFFWRACPIIERRSSVLLLFKACPNLSQFTTFYGKEMTGSNCSQSF